MTKPDDCSLDPYDRAAAWDRFPTPIDDILAAANLTVAPTSVFDPKHMLAYLRGKGAAAGQKLKKWLSKILGLYDTDTLIIQIDDSVVEVKQKLLKLHETGHHELPTHRKVFT